MKPDAVYERLLKLYPEAFRREFGADMLDIFRRLDQAHGRNRLGFWTFIISDVGRSACREIADATRSIVRFVSLCAAAVFVGSLLFYGLHRGIGALFGELPLIGRLVVRGALIGLGLGWAQCVVLGTRLITHRGVWQLLSLAGGIALWPATFAIIELSPPPARPLPENPELNLVVAATLGLSALLFSLDRLMHGESRLVAVRWMRMNVVALPAVILVSTGVAALRRYVFLLREPSFDPTGLVFLFILNPVALAIVIGTISALPLWRLSSHAGLASYRLERG